MKSVPKMTPSGIWNKRQASSVCPSCLILSHAKYPIKFDFRKGTPKGMGRFLCVSFSRPATLFRTQWIFHVALQNVPCSGSKITGGPNEHEAPSVILLGHILHFCALWFSGKSPVNC